MTYHKLLALVVLASGLIDVVYARASRNVWTRENDMGLSRIMFRADTQSTCLDPKNINKASSITGQESGTTGIAAGQSPSETDPANANFINTACQGKTLTNGQQIDGGSCSTTPQGDIPASDKVVSSLITSPQNGDDLQPNTKITIKMSIANLELGTFTNPDVTYYSAPQRLNNGNVVGHVHITCQDLGGTPNPTKPLDGSTFVHFKGIDDAGDGNGNVQDTIDEGLPPGFYRCCTMTASQNHAPVIMPKAKRGAQDDCIRFSVGQGKGNGGANGGNAATLGGGGSDNGSGNGGQNNDNKGNGGNNKNAGNVGDNNTNNNSQDSNANGQNGASNTAEPASTATAANDSAVATNPPDGSNTADSATSAPTDASNAGTDTPSAPTDGDNSAANTASTSTDGGSNEAIAASTPTDVANASATSDAASSSTTDGSANGQNTSNSSDQNSQNGSDVGGDQPAGDGSNAGGNPNGNGDQNGGEDTGPTARSTNGRNNRGQGRGRGQHHGHHGRYGQQ